MQKIATALVKAQKAFGPALKSSTNPHFKSRYADLAACVEAVIAGLNDNGIALIQKCYDCPNGVMVETMFVHESGEMLECGILHVPASKQDPQGYGSALTYARRYSLMAACGIAPEDDDGNSASRKTEIKSTVDEHKIADLLAAMDETNTMDELQKAYKSAYAAANGEAVWQKQVIARKDAKKSQLEAK
ncbi:Essential recombination function protein [uncultured Caudovirales phage]|uniref:Essential recombination function protein n=1 Tax=uncultured Caudovirales phage TaxID=2100421 RepID=A0A6J7WFL6_9CAUD|nr:Essential recombination function protein [uncultured Caudovirales phage]